MEERFAGLNNARLQSEHFSSDALTLPLHILGEDRLSEHQTSGCDAQISSAAETASKCPRCVVGV